MGTEPFLETMPEESVPGIFPAVGPVLLLERGARSSPGAAGPEPVEQLDFNWDGSLGLSQNPYLGWTTRLQRRSSSLWGA